MLQRDRLSEISDITVRLSLEKLKSVRGVTVTRKARYARTNQKDRVLRAQVPLAISHHEKNELNFSSCWVLEIEPRPV